MPEALLEYPRIHQDGQKYSLINLVSLRIRSPGTKFHSTNTIVQKSRRDATLRTAINSKFASCLGLYSSFVDLSFTQHIHPILYATPVGCRPDSMLVVLST